VQESTYPVIGGALEVDKEIFGRGNLDETLNKRYALTLRPLPQLLRAAHG
jgi:hypothetical protein